MKQDEIKSFYQNSYNEDERMERNPLEFIRCKEIISRYLTADNMEIADIGGATGAFSYWLAEQNHRVHLLDFTPSHIEKAKEIGRKKSVSLVSCICDDARKLPYKSNSFDIVLEMGPLYHLQDRKDRIQCLTEAKRVLKPDGVLLCEVISRYASLIDGFKFSLAKDEKFIHILDNDLETGMHSPGDTNYFTTSFFHTPDEIEEELKESGFKNINLIALEGFANTLNSDEILKDDKLGNLLLKYIRETENVREMIGISDHYFAITKKE